MRDKLDMPAESLERLLKAGTLKECFKILEDAYPGIWPKVYIDQLPDAVNRHLLAVMRRNAGEIYDPPPDPKGFSRK